MFRSMPMTEAEATGEQPRELEQRPQIETRHPTRPSEARFRNAAADPLGDPLGRELRLGTLRGLMELGTLHGRRAVLSPDTGLWLLRRRDPDYNPLGKGEPLWCAINWARSFRHGERPRPMCACLNP